MGRITMTAGGRSVGIIGQEDMILTMKRKSEGETDIGHGVTEKKTKTEVRDIVLGGMTTMVRRNATNIAHEGTPIAMIAEKNVEGQIVRGRVTNAVTNEMVVEIERQSKTARTIVRNDSSV